MKAKGEQRKCLVYAYHMSGSVDPIHPEVVLNLQIALNDGFNNERIPI